MEIECKHVVKENNSLIFRSEYDEYCFDLKTREVVDNSTGEIIEDFVISYSDCPTYYEDFLCRAFINKDFSKLDSLLSYYVVAMYSTNTEGREHRCLNFGHGGYDYDYGLMPKGFTKFVEMFDDINPAIALQTFDIFNTLSPKESPLFRQLISSISNSSTFEEILEEGKFLNCFKALLPCVKNTARNLNRIFELYNDTMEFLCLYRAVNYNEKYLDVTKDLANNVALLTAAKNKERGIKVIAQEMKILALENLLNDDFVVVVPKTLEDFTDEGRQQHNCVGYYYHDSIVEGTNFIYFLRKKSDPTHSFVTCRYNTRYRETTEFRMFDNRDVDKWTDEGCKVVRFIDRIDREIHQILG